MADIDFDDLDLNSYRKTDKDETAEAAKKKTGKLVNLLLKEISTLTGGDGEQTDNLMDGLLAYIRQQGGLLNGLSNQAGPTQPLTPQQPIASLGAGAPQTQTQPLASTDKSDVEKLGERIMKLTGHDLSRASVMVKFVEDAFGIDPNLLPYANQAAAALSRTTNPDELIQLPTGEWVLKSQQTKAKKAGLYEDAFDELVSLITGSNTTDPVAKELARAKADLAKLMSGTGTPSKDDVTKLLDTLAGKLNITRNGDDNPTFQPKVVKAAEDAQYWSNQYGATRREIIGIATTAPFNLTGPLFDVNAGGTSAEIVKAIVAAAAKLPGGADAIRAYLKDKIGIDESHLTGKSADELFKRFVAYVRKDVEDHYDGLSAELTGNMGSRKPIVKDTHPLKGAFPEMA